MYVMFKRELRGRKQKDEAEETTRSWDVENGRRIDQGRAKNYQVVLRAHLGVETMDVCSYSNLCNCIIF